jgi:tRNA(Ile)-lysidine synthase
MPIPKLQKILSPLEQRVLRTIKQYGMISPGDHVLAAVSGGADSVAMLHMLSTLKERLKIQLSIAHMDHGIRGEAARREGSFVQELAGRFGLACVAEARDVPAHKGASGLSLQEAAREVRYGFYRDAMAATGANKLALGHHADDQAETVIMRLIRGASLKGLAGIPACRDGYIIRPLIGVERREIEAWLNERGIAFVPDTSAGEQHYLRNKIRHQLLPLLREEYNSGIVATLGRTADLVRQDEQALEALVEDMVHSQIETRQDEHTIAIAALQDAGPDLYGRCVRRIIAGLKGDTRELTEKHIAAVIRLIEKSGPSRTVQLPGPWCVRRHYGALVFARRRKALTSFNYTSDEMPACISIAELGVRLLFELVPIADSRPVFNNADKLVAYIAADTALDPVTVRSWQPGDVFYPLGAPGSKKLKDLFSDLKIPPPERRRVPVLLFGDRIAWVCGVRLDERFKVLPGKPSALKVTMKTAAHI